MELVGAIKIKDGLFLGDEFAAQDLEFVVANKVSHVINTAARQIPNHWEPIGVQYLDFYWLDQDAQQLFDTKDEVVGQFCSFIERAVGVGESVLVHSVRGQCRSVVVIVAYLMRKYRWTMVKSFEFVNSRRPDLSTRPSFIQQLLSFESRFSKQVSLASEWDPLPSDPEELVLRNTFLNSQFGQLAEMTLIDGREKVNKLNWTDCGEISTQLIDLDRPNVQNRVENGFVVLRSCLKGRKTMGEVRVPLPVLCMDKKQTRQKNELLFTPGKMAKAAERAMEYGVSATAEDVDPPIPRRKPPQIDAGNSGKKPRASSAGNKDPSPKVVNGIRKARTMLAVQGTRAPPAAARTIGPYSMQGKGGKKGGRPGNGGSETKGRAAPMRVPSSKKRSTGDVR